MFTFIWNGGCLKVRNKPLTTGLLLETQPTYSKDIDRRSKRATLTLYVKFTIPQLGIDAICKSVLEQYLLCLPGVSVTQSNRVKSRSIT